MHYFVGWDVGAWGCRSSSRSQDSLAVLCTSEDKLVIVNRTWRGNLAKDIRHADTLSAIIKENCGITIEPDDKITIAIDTPLGLPADTLKLFDGNEQISPTLDRHSRNSLIYRRTEMWLAEKNFPPLSAIKDMIGSQATKGVFFLRRFGFSTVNGKCGVWQNDNAIAIECYPTTCKRSDRKGWICHGSASVQTFYRSLLADTHDVATEDEEDAIYCALVAYLYERNNDCLVPPQESPPTSEGWIWYPQDAVGRQSKKKPKTAALRKPKTVTQQ